MCGIAGFCTGSGFEGGTASKQAEAMADAITHRGPDDSGVWVDPEAGIALAHRRLSILDLSSTGHQPMVSASGRYVIVFNGEIYNHNEIRNEVDGNHYQWKGTSDTESLLAGIETWGLEVALKKCVGMFALVLWDRKARELLLARDRMGEKPLYYGNNNGLFFFGSELKAIKAHPEFQGTVDRDSVALFMRHNYIPAPYSIYRGIKKLEPGTWLRIPETKFGEASDLTPSQYWSLENTANQGQISLFSGSDDDALGELERLLKQSIRGQMVSDVPLGAFLSGGIDSSTVVALMQAQSRKPVKTFTIGFDEEGYNEANYAKEVARHLGTDHTELYVTPKEAMEVIPRLPALYDEPFSDSSQIPTSLISQLTRENVTVSLSGDGGDELFGGYNRYMWTRNIWRKIKRLPPRVRQLLVRLIRSQPSGRWDRLYALCRYITPQSLQVAQAGDKMHKLAALLTVPNSDELYRSLVSHWKSPQDLVLDGSEPSTILTRGVTLQAGGGIEQRMMLMDGLSYLPDDILVKVDRAAMGESLETRVPLLDHRVVEFAWSLPLQMKIREGQGKWILRKVLQKHVPSKLFERPKMGFGVPVNEWLRGPLRDWAEELLSERRLKDEGFLMPNAVRDIWGEHLKGKVDHAYWLWDVLMFQSWLIKHNAE